MRLLSRIVLWALWSVAAGYAAGQGAAAPVTTEDAALPAASAQLLEPLTDYKLGDTIRIKVKGKHQINVVNSKAGGVLLVLDEVVMKSLGSPIAVQDGNGTDLVLAFALTPDQQNENSRKDWNQLLGQQHGGYQMTLPVALAIGNAAALPVAAGDGLQFYITTALWARLTMAAGAVLFVLIFWWLKRGSALMDHPGGQYSLGKSQMAFWGLLVLLSFLGVLVNTHLIVFIPQQVLILLGISGATGLGAIVISNGKKAAEIATLEEKLKSGDPDPKATEARLKELHKPTLKSRSFLHDICDDGNGISFHRLQTVLWTLTLGGIFITSVIHTISMPEFPDSLLTLMGISNSIYLGFKFPEKA